MNVNKLQNITLYCKCGQKISINILLPEAKFLKDNELYSENSLARPANKNFNRARIKNKITHSAPSLKLHQNVVKLTCQD